MIQDRRHALNIAAALIGHADAIDIPLAIYLDVSAKDSDWPDLIRQLAFHRNIRILVTIREEDYKRASIPDFEIPFKDVDLNFDKLEAQEIYHSLEKTKMPPQFLSFEEAWDKFGGEGPLMEFIHLVTQGESLRKRLKEQITRLQNEARSKAMEPEEIDLLRLVSVASAFDAYLKVKPIIDHLKLAAAPRTFELFEKEYLLERNADGSLVKGLHPIRSEILADLLIDRVMFPWSEYAITCISLMHEIDIESFLLHSFSRHKEDTESLIKALNLWHPDRWATIGGITRALIWLGISEYVESNRELIQNTFKDSGTGFTLLLDSDISNAMPGVAASSLDSLCSLGIINEGNRQRIISYRGDQTDKAQVFMRAKAWLSSRTVPPKMPQCNEDWSGIAESSFWLGQLGISRPFSERIPYLELEKAIDYLPMEILADLILGLSTGYGKDLTAWLTENRPKIINRFREETLTVSLQDDGNKVTAHFIIGFEKLNDPKFGDCDIQESNDPLHDEAVGRLKLLRGILPDRDAYACQGYGHKLWIEELPLDNTQKTGIPRSQLPPKWLTSINSVFRGLAEQSFRSKTWEEYAKSVFELRKQNLSAMNHLENGLKPYFENQKPDQLFGELINAEQWFRYQQLLSKSPLIPSCAVDEWGFIDEFGISPIEEHIIIRGLALQKHKPFLAYLKEYIRYLSNFFIQSIHAMILNSARGRTSLDELGKQKFEQKAVEIGLKQEFVRLSRVNLADCVKIIPTFQRKFRRTFGQFFQLSDLDDLEKEEQATFYRIWCMWYFFSISPNLVQRRPEIKYVRKIDGITNSIKKNIQKGLSSISSPSLLISVISYELLWGDVHALWILVDGKNSIEVYNSIERIPPELCRSFGAFRDKELINLIFSTRWPLIIVIPTIQGKCLTNTAWRIYSDTLLWGSCDGKLGWWNYATQYPIPQDALTKLNISVWDLPQLEVAASLNQNTFKLSMQLASIRDCDRLPELDSQGTIQFKVYVQNLMDDISIVAQNVLDSRAQMMKILGSLSASDYNNHPNLVECRLALIEVNKYIMPVSNPAGKITLDKKTITEWANKLDEGKLYAALAYLFWANDTILDYMSKSKKFDQ